VALVSCGGGGGASFGPGGSPPSAVPTQTPGGRIGHVVIVVQENRSFDNLFHGYPGADTVNAGRTHTRTVALRPEALGAEYDLGHEHYAAQSDVDAGKMDGFGSNPVMPRKGGPPPPSDPEYVYVPERQVAPYWEMAHRSVLADRFFGELDGSYVSHQFLIAGQAGDAINVPLEIPWGCDSKSNNRIPIVNAQGEKTKLVYPCFEYSTLGDELDDRGIAWRYYAPAIGASGYIWSAYDAIGHIRLTSLWSQHVSSPETQFLADVASGTLDPVTWVVPSGLNSDHQGSGSTTGPAWVSSVVDAVGSSRFWDDSVIVVLWDDWGGLYDHVAPPAGDQFGPGIRVPLLVLSPYARRGAVAHTTYTFGSVMRLVEDAFGLPRLTSVDAGAASFGSDVFDFDQAPRPYPGPFSSASERARILAQPATSIAPDDD
jgi:phospholipase C